MVQQATSPTQSAKAEIIYPDSDGQPMAENTEHFELIVTIKGNLDIIFADDPNVFVAGDLLWYPVEGDNKTRQAPDVLVVFGRPKGYRGSYKQWEEDNLPIHVVFEIWSPSNRPSTMAKKFDFYDRYGVEEYYVYEPEKMDLTVWTRQDQRLVPVIFEEDWISPRLGVRFAITDAGLALYRPNGEPFLSFLELEQRARSAQERADAEQQRADAEQQRANAEQQRANAEQQRAEQAEARARALEERLRQLGIEPDTTSE